MSKGCNPKNLVFHACDMMVFDPHFCESLALIVPYELLWLLDSCVDLFDSTPITLVTSLQNSLRARYVIARSLVARLHGGVEN